MPKDKIEHAIKRGTGEDKDAAAFEQIQYEGYAPHGVALIIEVVTDNRNRTVADLRHHLTRAGGNLAEAGAVAWQFRRVAYFTVPAADVNPDTVFELAVEAGAEDVLQGDEEVEIIAPVESFKSVSDRLGSSGIRPTTASLQMRPNATVELSVDHTLQVMRVIEAVEDLDDVQAVFSTLQVTDEAVARLETRLTAAGEARGDAGDRD